MRSEPTDDGRVRFEEAFERAPIGMLLGSVEPGHLGEILRANEAFCRMVGRTEAELLGGLTDSFTHPDDLHLTHAGLEQMARGEDRVLEKRYVRPDGAVIWTRGRASLVRDPDGRPLHLLGVVEDITAEREARQALARSEERFRRIVETSEEAIWTLDIEGKVTFVNPRFERMCGYAAADILGRPITDLVAFGVDTRQREVRMLCADGREIWCLLSATALRDADGRYVGALGMAADITERKLADAHLAASEERYRRIIETATEGIWTFDRWESTTFVNARMGELLGMVPHDMVGRRVGDFLEESELRLMRSALQAEGGRTPPFDLRFTRADGTTMWGYVSTSRVIDGHGEHSGWLVMVADISARVAVENLRMQLQQSQRLEGIGRLAGGVAHDFNNLLSVILNYAHFAGEALADRPETAADVAEIRRAAERAAALTQQLLVFSRRDVVKPEVLDLSEVIADMVRLLERTLGADVLLVVDAEEGSHIRADRGQVEQIILNLAVNARDAMPGGGRLGITCRAVGDVLLTVTDTGAGMDEETVSRAFEPFFTTKGRGEGTGLGLATVYGIVAESGGEVSLRSAPGEGTTVLVRLPRAAEGPADRPGTESHTAAGSGNGRRVLLVEDEPAVRTLTARILRGAGYEVVEAPGGQEALAVGGDGVDVLLTDLVMPGMSGKEVAETLRAQVAELPVLYMSGYTEDALLREGIRDDRIAVLEKPFTADGLLDALRRTLEDG